MPDNKPASGSVMDALNASPPKNPVLAELQAIIERANHVILDYPGSGMPTIAEADVEHTIRYVNKCLKGLKRD